MATQRTSNPTFSLPQSQSYKSPSSSVSDVSKHESEDSRGREKDRDRSVTAKSDDHSCREREDRASVPVNDVRRKRKRSRKGLKKTFSCLASDCGKSYSRAEHLHRHQLNRTYLIPAMIAIGA